MRSLLAGKRSDHLAAQRLSAILYVPVNTLREVFYAKVRRSNIYALPQREENFRMDGPPGPDTRFSFGYGSCGSPDSGVLTGTANPMNFVTVLLP
jgi:hypothetical protein